MKNIASKLFLVILSCLILSSCGTKSESSIDKGQGKDNKAENVSMSTPQPQSRVANDTAEVSEEEKVPGKSQSALKCESFYPQGRAANQADEVINDEGPTVIVKETNGQRIEYGIDGAAANGNIKAVKMLYDCGVNLSEVTEESSTPLLQAIEGRNTASSQGDAALQKYDEVIDYMLEHGADPRVKSVEGRTPYMVAYILRDTRNEQRLRHASTTAERATARLYGDLSSLTLRQVQALVEQEHADVNVGFEQQNYPSFFHAIELERTDIALYLIKHGADLKLTPGEEGGLSIIQYAAAMDNLPVMKYLLENDYGFEINDTYDFGGAGGLTLLSIAVSHSNYEMTKYLIEHGANVNVVYTDEGESQSILQSVDLDNPNGLKIKELLISAGAK